MLRRHLSAAVLLHEALYDDLELRRLLVEVDRNRVSITIHQKCGTQEKMIIGEDSTPDNIHPLDERR